MNFGGGDLGPEMGKSMGKKRKEKKKRKKKPELILYSSWQYFLLTITNATPTKEQPASCFRSQQTIRILQSDTMLDFVPLILEPF